MLAVRLVCWCASLALLLLLSAPVAAQSTAEEQEARALFDAGAVAFSDGRFEDALERWQQSHALAALPGLLFNMGTAHDRLGHRAEALVQFRQYLREAPDAENENYVRRRIDVLEGELAEGNQVEVSDRPAPRVRAPSEPRSRSTLSVPALVTTSAGAALLIAGVVTGIAANGQYASLEANCADGFCGSAQGAEIDNLRTLTIATDVLLFGGAAVFATGLVWLLMSGEEVTERETAGLQILPSGVGVAGRF